MADFPVSALLDEEQSKPTVRYLSVYHLLTLIAVFAFIIAILLFTILGLLLNDNRGNKNDQNGIGQPSTAFLNASPSTALPPFTLEWKWHGNAYRYYMGDDLVNWPSALRKCNEQGFKLLDLESVEERDFIMDKISVKNNSGIPVIDHLYVWTSGYRDYNLTHWIWESTGQTVLHHLWSPGEPSNHHNNERCAALYFQPPDQNIMFIDGGCFNIGRYICSLKT